MAVGNYLLIILLALSPLPGSANDASQFACELNRENFGNLGPPSLKLGESKADIGFPIQPTKNIHDRSRENLEIFSYRSSGQFGNNPNLYIETIPCSNNKEVVVGISQSWAVSSGSKYIIDWLLEEYYALSQEGTQVSILISDPSTIRLSTTKGVLEIDAPKKISAKTILERSCRISITDDLCNFTNATVYHTINFR